jgi:hypothetical protein
MPTTVVGKIDFIKHKVQFAKKRKLHVDIIGNQVYD